MSAESLSTLRTLIIAFSLIALAASLVEGLALTVMRRAYDWRDALASLGVAVVRRFVDVLPLAIAMPGGLWLYEHRLVSPPLDAWWSWVLLGLGLEFCYYWYHRTAHRVRWFWASHAVHHSPNAFNLSAAYRLGWTSRIGGSLLFFLPLCALGFPPRAIAAAYALNLLYQFWIHAEWIPKLGPLEGWLNTPSAHRVHHAADLEYLDANYGGVLLVFDRLFGTYVAERDDLKPRYGWVEPLRSYNPLRIAFHQWVTLVRDLRRARSAREVAGYLFGPPGWSPDGPGSTTEALRARAGLDARGRPRASAPGEGVRAGSVVARAGSAPTAGT
ncbi:MAG: sterol desaturase family protein [Burkholderiales bacterium]|jgi:sterol desaturase/sphingolipid hydroxylase (fatty acid hydroxylase superfamily)